MAEPDITKYCDLMEEVKRRMTVIDFFLEGKGHAVYEPTTIESICLQIRKILELIALGSLVANKTAYAEVYDNFAKAWNAELLLKDIERVNPDFYPRPIIEVPSTVPGVKSHFKNRPDDFLTKGEFVKLYKKCAAIMHAGNPFGSRVDYAFYKSKIPEWQLRIISLLNTHEIHLTGNPNIYLIHMKEEQDDKVHWYTFSPVRQ